jgi:hypothetical protein
MTQKEDYGKQGAPAEAEIAVDAVPVKEDTGPPIPPGHQRFYCEKCRAVRKRSRTSFASLTTRWMNFVNLTDHFFRSVLFTHNNNHPKNLQIDSPMICHKMPPLGDVPTVPPSTRSHPKNVLGVPSCNGLHNNHQSEWTRKFFTVGLGDHGNGVIGCAADKHFVKCR